MSLDHIDFPCEFKLADAGTEAPQGQIEGYASVFGKLDRVGDIVMPGAFKASLADWRKRKEMPPILWQHDPDMPIGSWTDLVEDDKGLKAIGELELAVQKATEARALIARKSVRGLSIGFQTLDYEIDRTTGVRRLKKLDLWEISVVTFPALPEAQVTSVKTSFEANAWESAFRDGGLSIREAKLATSIARKMALRDAGTPEPPPRDGAVDVLLSLRMAAAAFRA